MTRRFSRPPRRDDDQGFSLIELMVSMLVLGMILTVLTQAIISTQRASLFSQLREQNTAQLRTGMDALTKSLRSATKLDTTSTAFLPSTSPAVNGKTVKQTGVECWFYTNVSPIYIPQLAHYYIDTKNRLIEEYTAPDSLAAAPNFTYTGKPWFSRVIGAAIRVPTGAQTPIFTYYPQSGGPLNGPNASTPTNVTDVIPDASLSGIGDVLVTLVAVTGSNAGTTTTVFDRVRLVNADTPVTTATPGP